jgi:hypothetical protein
MVGSLCLTDGTCRGLERRIIVETPRPKYLPVSRAISSFRAAAASELDEDDITRRGGEEDEQHATNAHCT